jgi:hypothetical protein
MVTNLLLMVIFGLYIIYPSSFKFSPTCEMFHVVLLVCDTVQFGRQVQCLGATYCFYVLDENGGSMLL